VTLELADMLILMTVSAVDGCDFVVRFPQDRAIESIIDANEAVSSSTCSLFDEVASLSLFELWCSSVEAVVLPSSPYWRSRLALGANSVSAWSYARLRVKSPRFCQKNAVESVKSASTHRQMFVFFPHEQIHLPVRQDSLPREKTLCSCAPCTPQHLGQPSPHQRYKLCTCVMVIGGRQGWQSCATPRGMRVVMIMLVELLNGAV
jgi:hypothetical protein